MDSSYIIEMRNITKDFGPLRANDNVTLQLRKGEVHALLGENGAGKSTLMSILFGLYQPDGGHIYKDGKPVVIRNPNDATALGIGMVQQHFQLVECFSVLDNIILGAEDSTLGNVTKKKAIKKVKELMDRYHLEVDLKAKVSDISVGMQQRVEILKMLYRENQILIFDEPTAVLTPQEIDGLMATIRSMAKEGKSILFISHKLNEIMKVSDRCTILRKGKWIATVNTADTDPGKLAEMMVGHHVSFGVDKTPAKPKEDVLTVSGLSVKNPVSKRLSVKDVSFHVRSGEIVTIAGIDGNGQDELVGALTGLEPAEKGTLTLSGHDISKASIRQRIADGMSHIPADRHKYGLVLDFTMEENTVLERYRDPEFRSKAGWIRFRNRHAYAEKIAEKYDVRSAYGVSSSARSMSGGNQQKLIAGRELEKQHSLLVAVQPVRGLDVGAISFLHQQMVKDRDEGKAILVVSLELDEVLSLSDRILVLYGGEIVGEFLPQKTSAEELGLYMAGAKRMTKEEMLAVEKEEA